MASNGFTLVEILITLSIIALISIFVIPNYQKFSSDQDLSNQTSLLIQTLRQAQANAQSGVQCSSNQSKSWKIRFSSTPNNYQLICTDIAGSDDSPKVNVTPGYPITSTDCSFPKDVVFNHNTISDSCTIFFGTTTTKTIIINKGGAIYEQSQ